MRVSLTGQIKKERESLGFYGRFFIRRRPNTTPTIAIEAMIAATAGKKYCSDIEGGVKVGAGVASAKSAATNDV